MEQVICHNFFFFYSTIQRWQFQIYIAKWPLQPTFQAKIKITITFTAIYIKGGQLGAKSLQFQIRNFYFSHFLVAEGPILSSSRRSGPGALLCNNAADSRDFAFPMRLPRFGAATNYDCTAKNIPLVTEMAAATS